jgi:hypothetical protein
MYCQTTWRRHASEFVVKSVAALSSATLPVLIAVVDDVRLHQSADPTLAVALVLMAAAGYVMAASRPSGDCASVID